MAKRATVAAIVVAVMSLGASSVAGATVQIRGRTWFADGSYFLASGPSGSYVSAFATGAAPNRVFRLVSSPHRDYPTDYPVACLEEDVAINPNLRFSNERGFIANTTGVLNRPPGEWEICFKEVTSDPIEFVTWAAYFTVV